MDDSPGDEGIASAGGNLEGDLVEDATDPIVGGEAHHHDDGHVVIDLNQPPIDENAAAGDSVTIATTTTISSTTTTNTTITTRATTNTSTRTKRMTRTTTATITISPQPRQPPIPHPEIEYLLEGMGEVPLQGPGHQLHRLCRKQLLRTDLRNLVITGPNRPFLRYMAVDQAALRFPLQVNVVVLDGPAPAQFRVSRYGRDDFVLYWFGLVNNTGFVQHQWVDMWFEMAPPTINIYIRGYPL